MIDIKKETEAAMSSLIVSPDIDSVMDLVNSAARSYGKICYVTFSRPYHSFASYLEQNRISPGKFFFIDCITGSVMKPKKEKNCIFISSPSAFEEVSNAVRRTLQAKNFNILIFDSLSSALIYENELFVTRFLHSLSAVIKGLGCKAVFVILEKDTETNIVKNMGMIVDKTIRL